MKKVITAITLCIILSIQAKSQFTTYVRFTDYSDKVLTTSGALETPAEMKGNTFEASSSQFLKVSSFGSDIEQSLNIGSTSTGAGAGKIVFNPFHITKAVDALTPTLFQKSASGTPYKTVEVFFVNNQNIVFVKYVFKLAAVKTMAWTTTCPSGCATPLEEVTFEYGGQIILVYKAGTEGKAGALIGGWNRVRNVVDNDPNSTVQQ